MALRILVDENTSPRIVTRLQDAGHDAVHVLDVLDGGAEDSSIMDYAEEHDYAVLTHDDDFLIARYETVSVIYYADDTISTEDLARKLLRLGSRVRSNRHLAPVTYLGEW